MNTFDCNKCMHQKVCAYKDKCPVCQDVDKDSVFEVKLHCKEYKEKLTLPSSSGNPVVIPYDHSWTIGASNQEAECQAYRDYVARAKDLNYIGDSPCSYCFKTSCPRSHVITCSNKSN